MVNFGKHGVKVPGAVEFAEWLDRIPGVSKVLGHNTRTRKIGPGRADPKFRAMRRHVEVQYFNGGMMLLLRVLPHKVVPVNDLYHRIEREYAKRNQRGQPGAKPSDPVVLPDAVRRRIVPAPAPTPSVIPIGTIPTPQEKSMHAPTPHADSTDKVHELSPIQARVYEYLLSLDQSGQLEFQVNKVYGQVVKELSLTSSQTSAAVRGLQKRGLVTPIDYATTGFAPQKRYRILRRPYRASKYQEPTSPPPSAKATPSTNPIDTIDSLESHLRFFVKHQTVLDEADVRRKALAKRGYELITIKGRIAIVPTK